MNNGEIDSATAGVGELPTADRRSPAIFSFVHAITELAPARHALGRLYIAEGASLPPCLAAEAVGQLAAWVAMAACDFARRPVAGIAGEVVFGAAGVTNGVIDLEVELETCDDDAVAYRGQARAGGRDVVSLAQCVGPMLPAEDFDDPGALRERFRQLVATPRLPPLTTLPDVAASCAWREIERDPGARLVAELTVPHQALFFADHFPRKPVFPATLFLDAQIRLAIDLWSDSPSGSLSGSLSDSLSDSPLRRRGVRGDLTHPGSRSEQNPPLPPFSEGGHFGFEGGNHAESMVRVRDVKMRSFISPGTVIEVIAELAGTDVRLLARSDGRRLSTASVSIQSERT